MTANDLVQTAIAAQREGRLDEAAALYDEILTRDPNQPEALHYCGVLLFGRGQHEIATKLIEKSLAIDPDQPPARDNLAKIYRMSGREDEALQTYWAAVACDPGHAEAWKGMAEIHGKRDDPLAASKFLTIAMTFKPDDPDLRHELGISLSECGAMDRAVSVFAAAIRDGCYFSENIALYVNILNQRDRPEDALALLLQWRDREPGNPAVEHHLNAQRGTNTPAATPGYIRDIFDKFADTFEEVLQGLDYAVPAITAKRALEDSPNRPIGQAVDLGCGTGLLGPYLKAGVAHLTGVDLSPKMLAAARGKGDYDALVEDDITAYLQQCPGGRFDLATAGDVLNYCGDLQPVFAAVARALKPGGRFVATFEILPDATETGYRLHTNGRYAHFIDYILACGKAAGFADVETERIPLRKEFGEPVAGVLVRFVKPV